MRLLRRALLAIFVTVVSIGALLAAEVFLAIRRDYLPTEPALEIGGTFGPETGAPLKLTVLGDSTAAGVGAGSPQDAYPAVLARRLGSEGYRVSLNAFGMSGARVADVLHDQVSRVEASPPELVVVAIGANDVTHVTPLDEVKRDMTAVLERLAATGASIVLAGAPDMRAAAFHEPLRSLSGWWGRRVEAVIADAGRAEGAAVVPLAEATGPEFHRNPELYNSADDFHPSAAGYRLWADAIYLELERAAAAR